MGPGSKTPRLPGTQVHDPILLDGEALTRPTDRSGGLEGGITTGQALIVRAGMKPIPTPPPAWPICAWTTPPTRGGQNERAAFHLRSAGLREKLAGPAVSPKPGHNFLRSGRRDRSPQRSPHPTHLRRRGRIWFPPA